MLNLGSLNPPQRLAVETTHGPVLILAGAGTGKTRVITCRIAFLISRGIAPGHILAVTFTNKAAREMQERVRQLLAPSQRASTREANPGERPERPTVSTFHSLCARILRQHIHRLGYKKNFVIYSESEQLGAIRKILSRISAQGEKTDPRLILSLLSRFKNNGAGALGADPAVAALAEHIRSRYETALHACNAVDFDDLLLLTLRLFAEFPDVLEACRAQYRYVMVDEYQDTNAAQFKLVHTLAREHRNLCVVGDDDQSIYGWRGAEVANLLELDQYYPEVKIIKLEQNYRSTNTILAAANALIKNNPRRRGKNLWSQKGQGAKVLLAAHADDETEARVVVEEIEFGRMARQIPWSDQAILFRTNLQSRPLETALRQAGVRYRLIGGQSYFDRREIQDSIAYLKALVNPHDDISLLRIANVPARGLSEVTMERLLAASQEKACSVFTAMRHTDVQASFTARTQESIRAFIGFLAHTRQPLESEAPISLVGWAKGFLKDCGYLDELRRSEKDPATADNRIQNVQALIDNLDQNAPGSSPMERLTAFIEDLALDADRNEEPDTPEDAVTLITIHSCKGLEFPHVFVVGVEDGLLPHSRSKQEGTLDEERRLFYVAITRAQLTLTLSHCAARKRFGQLMPCHPSPFLKELPADLIELADERLRQPVTVEAGKNLFANVRAAIG